MKKINENTVEGQLRKIEPKWLRDLALKRMRKRNATHPMKSIGRAIWDLTAWHETPEKYEFWEKVKDHFEFPKTNPLPADPYAKKKPAKPWKPTSVGETYYFVQFAGSIGTSYWDSDEFDKQRYKEGRVFRTLELARRAEREIKRVLKEANHG